MTIRFYLMPSVIEIVGLNLAKHPKYDTLFTGGERVDYGREGTFLIGADVTDPEHTALIANIDVVAFPVNLDNQIGANFNTVQAEAEARHIPINGITSTSTYRQLLRRVALCFQLGQRIEQTRFIVFRIFSRLSLFGGAITMATTMADLSVAERNILAAVFDSYGFDRSGFIGSTTLREVLISFKDQWGAAPVIIMGESLS